VVRSRSGNAGSVQQRKRGWGWLCDIVLWFGIITNTHTINCGGDELGWVITDFCAIVGAGLVTEVTNIGWVITGGCVSKEGAVSNFFIVL
jgi:hypothetical protein